MKGQAPALLVLCVVATAAATPARAHDPAFHTGQAFAQKFIETPGGRAVMMRAIERLEIAVCLHGFRKPDHLRFKVQGLAHLQDMVSGQFADSVAHIVRTWGGAAGPRFPQAHLKHCWVCQSLVNAILEDEKQPAIPEMRPEDYPRLNTQRALALLSGMNRKVNQGFSAEDRDLAGDGFINATCLDSENHGQFTTVYLDTNGDRVTDAIAQWVKGRWVIIAIPNVEK